MSAVEFIVVIIDAAWAKCYFGTSTQDGRHDKPRGRAALAGILVVLHTKEMAHFVGNNLPSPHTLVYTKAERARGQH